MPLIGAGKLVKKKGDSKIAFFVPGLREGLVYSRSCSDFTSRRVSPIYNCRGRPIF